MSNETEKDPVLSDKLYKRGSILFNIGLLSFVTLNCAQQIMYRNKWEILIGENFFNPFFIIILFFIVCLTGAIICLVACKRNKSKYTSRFIAIVVICSITLISTAALSIYEEVSNDISYSREEVNLPNDKTVTLIWEEHSDGEYLYICDMHGIFAQKVAYTNIFDHNHDYKFDYDENSDTYTVTTYHENSNGQTIPWTRKFKLK